MAGADGVLVAAGASGCPPQALMAKTMMQTRHNAAVRWSVFIEVSSLIDTAFEVAPAISPVQEDGFIPKSLSE
jgi:hypothetical protein